MFGSKFAALGLAAALLCAAPAAAVPKTYDFSGTLNHSWLFGPNSDWAFAAGQSFRGSITYDAAAVTSSFDVVSGPGYLFTRHFSPIVALSFEVDAGDGTYAYSVPTDLSQRQPGDVASHSAAVGAGNGWNGLDIRFQNYPEGWRANPPSLAVPESAYVGGWNPHAVFLTLGHYDESAQTSTSPDVDLEALFVSLLDDEPFSRDFAVRFSDSFSWPGGQEVIGGIFHGTIGQLTERPASVPAPAVGFILLLSATGLLLTRRRTIRAL
jgi:hypothetical protein